MITNNNAAHIKLHLLSEGISYSKRFLEAFSENHIAMEKRRAYNDSDDIQLDRSARVPQEILLNEVIIAMNHDANSDWQLDYDCQTYLLRHKNKFISEIDFPKRPIFFDLKTADGIECGSVANLYGGSAFALFTPSTCYYFSENLGCQFCSLLSNRSKDDYFVNTIKPEIAANVFSIALEHDSELLKSIMIVGGNMLDYDKGFFKYLEITKYLEEIQKVFFKGDIPIETHIATMPPKNLELFENVNNLNARITLNLEVFDDNLFEHYCKGKAKFYGRTNLKNALEYAAKKINGNRVHSILIAGLEPVESTIEGMLYLESIGVAPIINVFHRDNGAILQNHTRPSYNDLLTIAETLQKIYSRNNFTPYWCGCGRNSLDYEALNKWFNA